MKHSLKLITLTLLSCVFINMNTYTAYSDQNESNNTRLMIESALKVYSSQNSDSQTDIDKTENGGILAHKVSEALNIPIPKIYGTANRAKYLLRTVTKYAIKKAMMIYSENFTSTQTIIDENEQLTHQALTSQILYSSIIDAFNLPSPEFRTLSK